MPRHQPVLVIIIPCYNENEVLPQTITRIDGVLLDMISRQLISSTSYACYVDDGSRDRTWQHIQLAAATNTRVKGVKLSRNFGHQYALIAGLELNKEVADITISIDADLQDDIEVMYPMIDKYKSGAEIVYGVRDDRTTDTFFKRQTAIGFYKIMKYMGVETVVNHADYRLMSRQALKAFESFQEKNMYIRGIIPLLGFKVDYVYYARTERMAGHSKYNLFKMLSLAWTGVSSLSIKPLRFVTFCGFVVFFCSILMSVYALYSYFYIDTVQGWTSTVLPIYFLGGIQLLCIGLVGEYVANIYREVKQRPRYIIELITPDLES